MVVVQQVNIHCECHHRHGPLFVLRPWAWGRPCRRCRRMMERNLFVVPTSDAVTNVTVLNRRSQQVSPAVVSTTITQAVPMQQQQQQQQQQVCVSPQQVAIVPTAQTALDWQSSQEAYPSALPPKYNAMIAAN